MTTAQELIRIDITESGRQMQQYYKSSSLPFAERRKHKPKGCQYRRDRVLHSIMRREMEKALFLLAEPARKGGE
ncbi:DUF7301 family protein [Erwinia endophytica]|uniref:DUF7301 family protein n=1 Tax=Erwinia endophytica TaxID=1563158 RepID=UPI001F038106|nr:hypothetical protein [Erwinia endophytica]